MVLTTFFGIFNCRRQFFNKFLRRSPRFIKVLVIKFKFLLHHCLVRKRSCGILFMQEKPIFKTGVGICDFYSFITRKPYCLYNLFVPRTMLFFEIKNSPYLIKHHLVTIFLLRFYALFFQSNGMFN